MNQEDKQLLLKDLCARLPYKVKIEITWWVMGDGTFDDTTLEPDHIEELLNDEYPPGYIEIKPYLRSMSSMTEEEKDTYDTLTMCNAPWVVVNWLNANKFDYLGLIPKCLAIEVTEENNPYEKINL